MSEIRTDTINNASGDNDSGIDLSTNDQVGIKTANTTALTVDASQNVGIGTSSPTEKLTISSGNLNFIGGTNDAQYIKFGDTGDDDIGNIFYYHGNNNMVFTTNASEAMRVDSSGNLLVGTTSSGNAGGISLLPNNSEGAGTIVFDRSNTTNTSVAIAFENNNSGVGFIKYTNTSTTYETSSDHRLKENVTADWDATTRLKQLNPVRFNFIADADRTVDGFLAHEVQSVVPEAISGTHNEVEVWKEGEELPDGVSVGDNKLDEDGNTIPVYQGIDQSKLVPLLVKTIQELEARITALESE